MLPALRGLQRYLVVLLQLGWLLSSAHCSSYGPPSGSTFASAPTAPFATVEDDGDGPVQYPAGSLYFPGALAVYSDVTFVGNGGCSTSATYDYLTVSNITVPSVERPHLALHLYQAQASAGLTPPLYEIVYLDLQTGQFVTASSALNWTTQTNVFNYTTYGPNLVDYSTYVNLLNSTLTRVAGLATGQPGNPCSPADDRLDSLVMHLQAAQVNVSNPSLINGGVKPTELRLPSGCIQELDSNYMGTTVSGILTAAAGTSQTVDTCCQKCKQAESCNVFTYCPIQGGCPYGVNQTFPYQGCQLKNQPGSSLSPLYTPPAYSRGPPEAFTSGRT